MSRIPSIALPKGAVITNPDGSTIKLTGLSILEMEASPKITVPVGTDVDLPKDGHKASSGTETKGPQGTRVGSPANVPSPGAELVVPACTLVEGAKANKKTELPDGTKVKTAAGQPPIIALATLRIF